jgi:hypothetical protein
VETASPPVPLVIAPRASRTRRLPFSLDPADAFYLIAGLLAVGLHVRPVLYPWLFADDYRANFFWIAQLQNPTLFTGDMLAAYFRDFQPPALVTFYGLIGRWTSPLSATKLVSLGMVVAYFTGARYLGRQLYLDPDPRWVFAAWLSGNGRLVRGILGGFSRGFAPPLLVWFLGFLIAGRPWLALLCVAIALLFHPISFATLGGAFGMWWLWQAWRHRKLRGPMRTAHLLVGATALALGLAGTLAVTRHSREVEQRFGPVLTQTEVRATAPEWQVGSRFERERPRGVLLDYFEAAVDRIRPRPFPVALSLFALVTGLAAGAGVLVCWRRRTWPPAALICCALAAAAAYEVAAIEMPRFYMPNRYLAAAATVVAGAFVAIGLAHVREFNWPIRQLVNWRVNRDGVAARICSSPGRALAALTVALGFVGGLIYSPPSGFGRDLRAHEPAARWLRARLAPDQMFAAFPSNDGDNLLTLAERPCLITCECDHPIYSGYLRETRRRLTLLFRAYYAFGAEDVAPLAGETPVRFLVIRREDVTRRLAEGRPRLYRAPHGAAIQQWLAAHAGARSYWASPRAPAPVYSDALYEVFDLAPYRPTRAAFAR